MCTTAGKNIILDKPVIETCAEETVILAEEMGHYETDALYMIETTINSPISRSNIAKFEAQARYWSYERLLPANEIRNVIKRHKTIDTEELAEHFGVTAEFLHNTVDYYKTTGTIFEFHCYEEG